MPGLELRPAPSSLKSKKHGEHHVNSHDEDRSKYLKHDQIIAVANAVTVAPNLSAAVLRRIGGQACANRANQWQTKTDPKSDFPWLIQESGDRKKHINISMEAKGVCKTLPISPIFWGLNMTIFGLHMSKFGLHRKIFGLQMVCTSCQSAFKGSDFVSESWWTQRLWCVWCVEVISTSKL